MDWYSIIVDDPVRLTDAIEFFETELKTAKIECKIIGSVENCTKELPSITENRFCQLQVIEGILEFLNIELKHLKNSLYRKYLESYARALSSSECMKFVEGEEDVYQMEKIINRFALLRNQWLAISKGLDQKSFALSNIIRLRCAGLDDASL